MRNEEAGAWHALGGVMVFEDGVEEMAKLIEH